jgi:hypothetical protein
VQVTFPGQLLAQQLPGVLASPEQAIGLLQLPLMQGTTTLPELTWVVLQPPGAVIAIEQVGTGACTIAGALLMISFELPMVGTAGGLADAGGQ